jgi:hypothetical protein
VLCVAQWQSSRPVLSRHVSGLLFPLTPSQRISPAPPPPCLLTGNQLARNAKRLVWNTVDHVVQPSTTNPKPIDWVAPSGQHALPGDVVINLWPMKIRTFAVTFQ